jgi:hypothetical protein
MVKQIRNFKIDIFPVIIYDDGSMESASKAFCIFRALNYPVFVIYGGLTAYCECGLATTDQVENLLPSDEFPVEINPDLLQNFSFSALQVKTFPFNIFEVLGEDFNKERLKKLLETHGFSFDIDENVFEGPGAALFALCVEFILGVTVKVFLGEWFEVETPTRKITLTESFHTVQESLYYDADEGSEVVYEKVEPQELVVHYYTVPDIQPNRVSVTYQYEKYGGNACKNCIIC